MTSYRDPISFTARRDLHWSATIDPGLLDWTPDQHPDLFGSLHHSRRRVVVIDQSAYETHGPRIRALLDRYRVEYADPLLVPGGEASKTDAVAWQIRRRMDKWGMARLGEPLLVWGGGVCHDVGGFAAATYRREVPYIAFATTLVAAIDASFALKVGTNDLYKNRIGSYHPPISAYTDPSFFATLTTGQILDGVGEIFKVAVALDAGLFALLESDGPTVIARHFQGQDNATLAILGRTITAMAAELSANPYESNPARASYAGHSISPAMEPQLTHGAAVVLDLLVTTMISWRRGHVSIEYRDRIVALARALGLACWDAVLEHPEPLRAALRDTALHRGGRQLVPAPTNEPGRVAFLNGITDAELRAALDDLHAATSR